MRLSPNVVVSCWVSLDRPLTGRCSRCVSSFQPALIFDYAAPDGAKVTVTPNYTPIEYPKWVDGVPVRNADEERAHRAALAEAADAARAVELARPASSAGIRMRRTRERRREGRMSIRCDISSRI
jgi:hypothetical protein